MLEKKKQFSWRGQLPPLPPRYVQPCVDFKTGFKLLSDPNLWKTPTKQEETDMKKRVAALKRSYDVVKRLGFKGSYTSFVKKLELLKNHLSHFQDLEAQ